ncbi:MAG: alternate F1F0 ATPase, F1 subunit alpha [Chloroflexota bacterium]
MSHALDAIKLARHRTLPAVSPIEIGTVRSIEQGVARVGGLPNARSEEVVLFSGDIPGLVFDLNPDEMGVIVLGDVTQIASGSIVRRSGHLLDVPVGEAMLGRVVDALGNPLDDHGAIRTNQHMPIERDAPPVMERAPVTVPLHTGIKVIDALFPIGRGQRELIIGDRQTGKTAIAVDAIINQINNDVICIYCAIGQRSAQVARTIHKLQRHNAMANTIVMFASGEGAPGLVWVAPYAATTLGEYFMEHGRDVLIVYDDLTRHARAYRELSLLLRRPPGREAFPGDIFYIHSRLLERSTHLRRSGGTLTALPIVETQAQNISAYIPTNLISITDGQIYLSPGLFRRGVLPAVDVGQSVSRVGGDAQLPAYRKVAGDLRLSYTQFEDLESFARFDTHLDDSTRHQIERGRRMRELLKQDQYEPITPAVQITLILALNHGLFDEIPISEMKRTQQIITTELLRNETGICRRIEDGLQLGDDDLRHLVDVVRKTLLAAGLIHAIRDS